MLAQSSSGGQASGHTAAKAAHAHTAAVTEAVNAAISQHAAQHVLNVVQHHMRTQAATHAAHGAAHHQATHLGPNPLNPHIAGMLARFAQHEVANSMAHPQYPQGTPMMMTPQGMLPAPQAPQGYAQQQVQGPQGYQQQGGDPYAGNNSIANPNQGGDSGIMGLLQGIFG